MSNVSSITNAAIVSKFLSHVGVSFTAASAGWRKVCADYQSVWKCLFKRPGKQWTVRFHMGSGHKDPPTAYDVLDCVVSDYWIETNDDWDGLGYEEDEVAKISAATLREIAGFQRFFTTDEFQLLVDHLDDLSRSGAKDERPDAAFVAFQEGE